MSENNDFPQTVSSLTILKKWLESHLAKEEIKLKQPRSDNRIGFYRLAEPAVHIGLVPPDGILDPNGKTRIPCLVVGMMKTDDDREETNFSVRITGIVYDPGIQDGKEGQLQPNFDGYLTLLNFLDRVKSWLLKEDGVENRLELKGSVALTPYEEQPWPYWYGCLEMVLSSTAYPKTRYTEALR